VKAAGFESPVFRGGNIVNASSSDSVVVEVRAAEGGADAKLLVLEQVKIYLRLCTRRSL
jgi:protein subunit release factor A